MDVNISKALAENVKYHGTWTVKRKDNKYFNKSIPKRMINAQVKGGNALIKPIITNKTPKTIRTIGK